MTKKRFILGILFLFVTTIVFAQEPLKLSYIEVMMEEPLTDWRHANQYSHIYPRCEIRGDGNSAKEIAWIEVKYKVYTEMNGQMKFCKIYLERGNENPNIGSTCESMGTNLWFTCHKGRTTYDDRYSAPFVKRSDNPKGIYITKIVVEYLDGDKEEITGFQRKVPFKRGMTLDEWERDCLRWWKEQ